jgi:glycosyltransferase involved in cell wall biosynthesis
MDSISTVLMERIVASVGKVLIIVQNLPVPFDRRVWLESLALKDAGYDVSVICPKGKRDDFQTSYEVIDDIHIYRYLAPPEANGIIGYIFEFIYCWLATAIISLKVLVQRGFDVIHACNPPETYFLLAGFYKIFGKMFIFDHHDLSPEMYVAKGGKKGGILYRGLLWLEKMTFRTADVIITTNDSHKEIGVSRGGKPPENIFVVRSGPDFNRLKIVEHEPELKNGFDYLCCYLGEMCSQDGVDLLLESIKFYVQELNRQDTKFVLMGGGPEFEKLVELSRNLSLEPFVDFTGRVSDHDLCRYLTNADVCVDPDPYTEWSDKSTMNKIMEYMAFGKPIVAYDLKENRYSAQGAALYSNHNDIQNFARLISELLSNSEKRASMAEIGIQRVQTELAWEFSIPKLLDAYKNLRS